MIDLYLLVHGRQFIDTLARALHLPSRLMLLDVYSLNRFRYEWEDKCVVNLVWEILAKVYRVLTAARLDRKNSAGKK